MLRILAIATALFIGGPAAALDLKTPFASIDGGSLSLSDWDGRPVLVVNTASQCGFTGQYRGLQDLFERYRDRGVIVLAVPSDDFRQELGSNAEVKEFCDLQYGIDMPMTGITHVRGAGAHPFYRSVKDEVGFAPRWNFNKVLIGPDGRVAGTFGSRVEPLSVQITDQIDALLQ